MRYGTFMTTIEQVGDLTREEAERATAATLQTLAERITRGEAEDIASFLPEEMRPLLTSVPEPAEAFDHHEFIRRVAEREGVDQQTAFDHARAVFTALGAAVAPGELRDMVAQLPADYESLLAAAGIGRDRRAERPADLIGRVAELTGLDHDAARRATDAVLETLAVRISRGEVEDLENELPPDLRHALEEGLGESSAAKPMSLDEFVEHIARREGAADEEARRHARAVLTALREYVSEREYSDVTAQLPKDYAPILA
ncbi:MAG: hypothetical protein QOD13_3699 [Thermoleophilaceae bacterium]|jgi:uncharacterized protein (DUF2267 family)|nr:hypothetical protein [Thermoleophilaceae bacterium]